jgi:hypothetical protein
VVVMNEKLLGKWKKVEPVFEVIGLAVALTLVQIIFLYIAFSFRLFESYKSFFDGYLSALDALYMLVIYALSSIAGDSLLNVEVFVKMFERMFFIILLVNLAYFALSRYGRSRK